MQIRGLGAVLAALSMWVGGAGATVVEPLTTAEVAARADVVVHGRVVAVESGWHAARAMIYSTATVEVDAVLAGALAADEAVDGQVAVRWLGGRVGAVEQFVPGGAALAVGDEVVVFLRRAGGGYAFVGQGQGVVRVDPPDGPGVTGRARL